MHLGDEMQVPALGAVPAEREVDPVAFGRALGIRGRELRAPGFDLLGNVGPELTDCLAHDRALGAVELLDRLVHLGDDRLSPEEPALDILELVERCRACDRGGNDGGFGVELGRELGRGGHGRASASCRADSKHSTVPAIATLSDSAAAAMGMVT